MTPLITVSLSAASTTEQQMPELVTRGAVWSRLDRSTALSDIAVHQHQGIGTSSNESVVVIMNRRLHVGYTQASDLLIETQRDAESPPWANQQSHLHGAGLNRGARRPCCPLCNRCPSTTGVVEDVKLRREFQSLVTPEPAPKPQTLEPKWPRPWGCRNTLGVS